MLILQIENTIASLRKEVIPDERKQALKPLIEYIQFNLNQGTDINLNFICTHNSRRSLLSQVWAQVAANYYKLKNVFCYSGGTEATALYPMVSKTLENAGFHITKLSNEFNPVYSIKYAQNKHPIIAFSKTFDNQFNPQSKFAALMTCSQADEGCPFIPGCDKRIPVQYDDPKAFDATPQQKEKYQERSNQIASEMLFVFSQIKIN